MANLRLPKTYRQMYSPLAGRLRNVTPLSWYGAQTQALCVYSSTGVNYLVSAVRHGWAPGDTVWHRVARLPRDSGYIQYSLFPGKLLRLLCHSNEAVDRRYIRIVK